MRAFIVFMSATALSGCETVAVQYASPAPAGDFAAVEAQANDNYQYFAFPKAYLLVTPITKSSSGNGDHANDGAAQPSANAAGSSQQGTTTQKSKSKKPAKATSAAASDNQASGAAQQSLGGNGKASGEASSATTSNLGVTTSIIDGQMWEAKVVLMPADDRAFVVKGISGFFMSTTLGVTKYANSDVVSSVSSTAENLVPKRLGQIASVLSSIVQVGTIIGVDNQPVTVAPLQPFVVEVPSHPQSAGALNADWTYSFNYDSPPPAGTVTYRDFLTHSVDRKVSYWPTPACRSATLTIGRESDQTKSAFHVVVADPDVLRLQPLPVKGKVELGTVCGASISGSQESDALQTASDDLAAVQAAVKTLKDAKSGNKAAPAAAASGGAATQKK